MFVLLYLLVFVLYLAESVFTLAPPAALSAPWTKLWLERWPGRLLWTHKKVALNADSETRACDQLLKRKTFHPPLAASDSWPRAQKVWLGCRKRLWWGHSHRAGAELRVALLGLQSPLRTIQANLSIIIEENQGEKSASVYGSQA